MNTSTQAKKIAEIFSNENTQSLELADQTEILLSDTGYWRMLYFMRWLKFRRTEELVDLPKFLNCNCPHCDCGR